MTETLRMEETIRLVRQTLEEEGEKSSFSLWCGVNNRSAESRFLGKTVGHKEVLGAVWMLADAGRINWDQENDSIALVD